MCQLGGRTLAAGLCALAALLLVRVPPVTAEPWQPCGNGLPSFAPTLSVGAAPDQPGTLWAGTDSRPGLWHANGEEGSWAPVPGSPPTYTFLWDAGRQTWWAGTAEGLWLRPTGVTGWQTDPGLTGPVLDLALDGSGNLYAVQGQQGLVVRRARSGTAETWVALHDEPQALSIAVSSSGSDLYLGRAGRGLWVSLDGGGQWAQAPETGDDYLVRAW